MGNMNEYNCLIALNCPVEASNTLCKNYYKHFVSLSRDELVATLYDDELDANSKFDGENDALSSSP